MKTSRFPGWQTATAAVFCALALACLDARSENTNNADADKAWREVYKASQPPFPPAEWQTSAPTAEDQAAFYVPLLIKAADKAKDFYEHYPSHPKAPDARKKEHELLSVATQQFGDTNQLSRLEKLDLALLNDPKLSDKERAKIEQGRLRSRLGAVRPLMEGLPGTLDELEKTARELQKEFPKQDEPYQLLMMVAEKRDGDKSKAILKELAEGDAPDSAKEAARGLLKRLDAVGKPVDIQFTAVDGRQVNLASLKDKVVLIDFWATWCGPCVGEIPHVKEAYEKLHPKGFEIVGISFDQSKDSLEKFVAKEQMDWPQYFDGKGWGNKYGLEFGIRGIPTMWLVDKQGNLRDVNARDGLYERASKLLAE